MSSFYPIIRYILLYDRIGFGKIDWPLHEGQNAVIGGKEIELERAITKADYLSGRCFGASNTPLPAATSSGKTGLSKKFAPLKLNPTSFVKPYHPPAPEPGGRGIPLRPVNFTSTGDNLPSEDFGGTKSDGIHWTANWHVPIAC